MLAGTCWESVLIVICALMPTCGQGCKPPVGIILQQVACQKHSSALHIGNSGVDTTP